MYKILVIGTPKRHFSWGLDPLVLGLEKIGVEFDCYPNILTDSYNLQDGLGRAFSEANISYVDYNTMVHNLKQGAYKLIITTVCIVNYNGGKHGVWSKLSRNIKYSFTKYKFKMGGTLILDWLKKGLVLPPYVVIDDTDDPFIWPVDLDLLVHCKIYFKREMPIDRFFAFRLFESKLNREQKVCLSEKLKPFWFSYDSRNIAEKTDVTQVPPYHTRDIDLSSLCNIYSSYNRIKLLSLLSEVGERYNVVTTANSGKVAPHEFYKVIKRSKISVSLEGRGWDCTKHYELLLCGTLLFLARPSIETAIDFKDGENCVFIESNLTDFREKFLYYLENPRVSAEIACKGRELALHHLTNDKLAAYVLHTSGFDDWVKT